MKYGLLDLNLELLEKKYPAALLVKEIKNRICCYLRWWWAGWRVVSHIHQGL